MTNRFQTTAVIFLLAAATLSMGAATIYVTDLNPDIGSSNGCSLQDAISSANLNSTLEIASYDPDTHLPQLVQSVCVPGTFGGNTIVLPAGAVFRLGAGVVDDADNPTGPTATRMITSNIVIEAHGATLFWAADGVSNGRLFTVSPTGALTINNAYIKGFRAHGGSSIRGGGGGGLGAGGAIYVWGGSLVLQNCTFDNNGAAGGDGSPEADDGGGGGGGLSGDGNALSDDPGSLTCGGGGGGGGSGTFGAPGCTVTDIGFVGGGGGGTIFEPGGGNGAFACGGNGGSNSSNGQDGQCPGGGGGGGGSIPLLSSGNGGIGAYGGGGGGGGKGGGNGGNGGFGGGGGVGQTATLGGTSGGTGGFGGGGGGAADGIEAGHPGSGGKFGGNAIGPNGGGGAALGGAVFNDGGTVLIQNSTFANNFVTRGSGGGAGDNGADAGGAIFSRNGSLEVDNATISGNQGTGSGAGIVVVEDGLPTSLVLNDTIIFHNGSLECFVSGTVSITSAGNLIGDLTVTSTTPKAFLPCPSPVTSVDPQLGTLRVNAPGNTPTMSISKTSSAWNAGAGVLLQTDPQLQADQRGEPRPSMGGPDIGAFELCVDKFLVTCPLPPATAMTQFLTVVVSPVGEGSTNPSGTVSELENSVALLQTTPNPGFSFLNWSGPVSDPNSALTSTVIQESAVTVTANYVAGITMLSGTTQVRTGPLNMRVWPITIADAGVVVAHDVQINSFTLTQTFGTACAPIRLSNLPALAGDIAPGGMATVNLLFDFSSCATTARFTAQATFSANGGAVTGTMTRTNQLP